MTEKQQQLMVDELKKAISIVETGSASEKFMMVFALKETMILIWSDLEMTVKEIAEEHFFGKKTR